MIPAKAQSADGDFMDTSMDLCYTLGSHTEASSDLSRENSSQKKYRVSWSKGLSAGRGKRPQAARGSVLPAAKEKVSWGLQYTLT